MKKLVSLVLALLLALSCAACSPKKPAAPSVEEVKGVTLPQFSVLVNGAAVTNDTMAQYPVYSANSNSVNNSGTETQCVYIGYALSDVLKAAGVEEYTLVEAAAEDGYSVSLDTAAADAPTTLLALLKDNEPFKKGPWLAPCGSGTSGDYLKGTAEIWIDGANTGVPPSDEPTQHPGGDTEETGLPEILDRTDKVQFQPYCFLVNGTEVTNETLNGLSIYKVTVEVVNKKGETVQATYTGYRLSDVLAACGITEPEAVIAVANDGYESQLDKDTAMSEYTLLAIEKDKETGEDGTVWVAPCASTKSGDYVKLVAEIKAN